MTLLFFILSPTPDMRRRGLVIDINFSVYKKKWHVPSHLSYLFHAWINANGLRYMYLYIWRSIYDTLYMYHPSYKMEHNMLCLFSIHTYFEPDSKTTIKVKVEKYNSTELEKAQLYVYTDKIDICFSQCKFLFLFFFFFFWFVYSFTLKALSSVTSWNNFQLEFFLMSPFI